MSKSYVTMESKLCLTCGCEYSTGTILLDKRLQNRFERDTLTGWGLCDQHQKAFNDGMIAIVEVDESKSNITGATLSPDDAYRTGRVALVTREQLRQAINVPIPDKQPAIFISVAAFNKILPPEVIDNAPFEQERSTAHNLAPGSESIN